jgi:hypothetical protein
MFPRLPACGVDEEATVDLGRAASRMDSVLPVVDEGLANPRIPAGFAVLGQFIAHDITADRSLLAHHAVAGELRNFRSPRLDLECLYGDGPVGNPFLYDAVDADKLLLGPGEPQDGRSPHDVPRNHQGTALMGDPRNDVHLLISQLHLAFSGFHNAVVDKVRESTVPEGEVFEEARRAVRWHYQWIVVSEYLPLVCGEEVVADVWENGRRYYRFGGAPVIPVEFSDAAFRFGHAQVWPSYRLNATSGAVSLFPGCLGGRPTPPEKAIDWTLFFEVPGAGDPQPSRRIVPSLTHALMDLPEQITGHTLVPEHHSLASRDLQRGSALGLPSGETVAREMGFEPLTSEEGGLPDAWAGETPLWYYVLKEAEVRQGGERLGPVGGRIVAEVLMGLIASDSDSFLRSEPGWRPTLPAAAPGGFAMADLLIFAGAAVRESA